MIDRDRCYTYNYIIIRIPSAMAAAEQLSAVLIAALFSLLQLPIASVIVQS